MATKKVSIAPVLSATDKSTLVKFDDLAYRLARGDAKTARENDVIEKSLGECFAALSIDARILAWSHLQARMQAAYCGVSLATLAKTLANKEGMAESFKQTLIRAGNAFRQRKLRILQAAGIKSEDNRGGARKNSGGAQKAAQKAASIEKAATKSADPIPVASVIIPKDVDATACLSFYAGVAAMLKRHAAKNGKVLPGALHSATAAFCASVKAFADETAKSDEAFTETLDRVKAAPTPRTTRD